jgi:hypothetical protein
MNANVGSPIYSTIQPSLLSNKLLYYESVNRVNSVSTDRVAPVYTAPTTAAHTTYDNVLLAGTSSSAYQSASTILLPTTYISNDFAPLYNTNTNTVTAISNSTSKTLPVFRSYEAPTFENFKKKYEDDRKVVPAIATDVYHTTDINSAPTLHTYHISESDTVPYNKDDVNQVNTNAIIYTTDTYSSTSITPLVTTSAVPAHNSCVAAGYPSSYAERILGSIGDNIVNRDNKEVLTSNHVSGATYVKNEKTVTNTMTSPTTNTLENHSMQHTEPVHSEPLYSEAFSCRSSVASSSKSISNNMIGKCRININKEKKSNKNSSSSDKSITNDSDSESDNDDNDENNNKDKFLCGKCLIPIKK